MYTDPEGMPDDERMAPVEMTMVREWLALGEDWLAGHFGVDIATVWAWEAGDAPVPDTVRIGMEKLEAQAAQAVAAGVEALNDMPEPAVLTYRTDAEYRQREPEQPWPASWHRRVVARIAQEVPGLVIVSPDDAEG